MKVAIKALIKQVTVKSLVSGDKEARLTLDFLPKDEDINILNQLHKPDDTVMVVIMDKKSVVKNKEKE